MKDYSKMDYWELRSLLESVIPRTTLLLDRGAGREDELFASKGRKAHYREFNLARQGWVSRKRELSTDAMKHFLEVSTLAAECPMPLNLDVWDAPKCPFRCIYCFADRFRQSLYTSFYDNVSGRLRCCSKAFLSKELPKYLRAQGKSPEEVDTPISKAIAIGVPIRFGIRFEDFTVREGKEGASLHALKILKDHEYPVMINTKSDLVAEDAYVEALHGNRGGRAVHITLLTVNEKLCKLLEPGAPSAKRRLKAAKVLSDAGIRVVARIEPFLPYIADSRDEVDAFTEAVWDAGVRNITLDNYSYGGNTPSVNAAFARVGLDLNRVYGIASTSQWLGSLLLGKFMEHLRSKGFSCSTFDQGNARTNDQTNCCEAGDVFKNLSRGNLVNAVRYVWRHKGPVCWSDFRQYVLENGGFLSAAIEKQVHQNWDLAEGGGNTPGYNMLFSSLLSVGSDVDGTIWQARPDSVPDWRVERLKGLLK